MMIMNRSCQEGLVSFFTYKRRLTDPKTAYVDVFGLWSLISIVLILLPPGLSDHHLKIDRLRFMKTGTCTRLSLKQFEEQNSVPEKMISIRSELNENISPDIGNIKTIENSWSDTCHDIH
jgi:hypothetical protein